VFTDTSVVKSSRRCVQ